MHRSSPSVFAIVGWLASMPCASGQTEWVERDSRPQGDYELVFDGVRGAALLQSRDGPLDPARTWEWRNGRWSSVVTGAGPAGFLGADMVFDAGRNRTLHFGGMTNTGSIAQAFDNTTWSWDGAVWTALTPSAAPSPRGGHAMVYDAARDEVVLHGGNDFHAELGETWTWDGATWTRRTPVASPGARTGHAMAYDPVRQRVVLFGGSLQGQLLFDTWEWDGRDWLFRLLVQRPAGRIGHAMAFDPQTNRVVMFGAGLQAGAGLTPTAETWTWDGSTWQQQSPSTSPEARGGAEMAWDPTRSRLLLSGGGPARFPVPIGPVLGAAWFGFSDSWLWDGSNWTRAAGPAGPPPSFGASLTFDRARGVSVLSAGGDTWEWNGVFWHRAHVGSPGGATTFDAARGVVVLVPGDGTIWEWNGANWTQSAPANAPPARFNPAVTYDVARSRLVMWGGHAYFGTGSPVLIDEVWEYDGVTWTQAPSGPPPETFPSITYDERRQVSVVFGVDDAVWEWNGAVWRRHQPSFRPAPREQAALAYDASRGRVVLFGGHATVGSSSVWYASGTWEWDGVQWHSRGVAAAPEPRRGAALTYDSWRSKIVLFGGEARNYFAHADTWEYGPIHPASVVPYGVGCAGSFGTPRMGIGAHELPWIGDAVNLSVASVPPATPGALVFGLSSTHWGSLSLPLPLGPIGMPGCNLLSSVEAFWPLVAGGAAPSLAVPIPDGPRLAGSEVFVQALLHDPTANALGVVVSDGMEVRLGAR